MVWLKTLITLMFLSLSAVPALAWNPDEALKDPVLEARAREISAHLRCLVCQNQSIDDSDADLAKDLRLLVRERLVAGDTDDEVFAFLVSRYGEFVLLKPRLGKNTLLLWGLPAAFLILGGGSLLWVARQRKATATAPALTEAEKEQLAKIISDE